MKRTLSITFSLFFVIISSVIAGGKVAKLEDKDRAVTSDKAITAFAGNRKIKKQRLKAACRKRVIFNDDGCDLGREVENYSPEDVVKVRLKPLTDTQVTTISFSILKGDGPTYDCKVQPIFGRAHVSYPDMRLAQITRNLETLFEAGTCPLKVIADFAHNNKMEFFVTIRMNDCHDHHMSGWITKWKRNHPHLLVDTTTLPPDMELYTTSWDFTHKEVRDRKFEIIEDVAKRYDLDGFELDYMRHPVLFSRTIKGLAVTEDEVEIINNFMRRIRKLTDAISAKRKKPLLISVRVPDTFKMCLEAGMDIKTWIREDLIDILIAGGGYSPCSMPVEEIVKFAHRYKVPVYPCNNLASTKDLGEYLLTTRALSSNWYRAGADGVYMFNVATPFELKNGRNLIETRKKQYACLYEVGNPKTLIGKNKIFAVDIKKDKSLKYYKFVSVKEPLPISSQGPIYHGLLRHIPITIGDDIKEAKDKGFSAKATLLIKASGPATEDMFGFVFNGRLLKNQNFTRLDETKQEYKFQFDIEPSTLKIGKNFLAIWANSKPKPRKPVEIYSIILKVDYSEK
jgi:hypothetical protein